MMNYRSWDISHLGSLLLDMLRLIRPSGLFVGCKKGAKSLLRRLGVWVACRPWLKKIALWIFDLLPDIKYRLHVAVYGPPPCVPARAQKSADLSPRAVRIYEDLKEAIKVRKV